MGFTISAYDKHGNCKICGSHVSCFHFDGCELGELRKELKNVLHSGQMDLTYDPQKICVEHYEVGGGCSCGNHNLTSDRK